MTGPLQLELIDDDGAPGPAPRPELAATAARLPRGVHLGPSSWSFPGWAGLVYDRRVDRSLLARRGLAACAAHPLFNAVGVDRSFYGALSAADWAAYAEQAPAGFRFVVKAPARVTAARRRDDGRANPRFLDPVPALDAIADMRAGLGDALGAVVLQFPPAPDIGAGRFVERLHRFLAALDAPVTLACEIRTAAWLGPAYAGALADTGAVHCYTVHPTMPGPAMQAARMQAPPPGPWVARWNLGHGRRYAAARAHYWPFDRLVEPDPATRAELVAGIRRAVDRGESALVTVNNKAEGSAPLSVEALAGALVDAGSMSPPGA